MRWRSALPKLSNRRHDRKAERSAAVEMAEEMADMHASYQLFWRLAIHRKMPEMLFVV